jgi:hypothetical protein
MPGAVVGVLISDRTFVPMPSTSACRLFVIFARDANVGVILRRGPSKWVQVIKWDTRDDKFDDGAWFHGRIYESACDVSPDGELFVYKAAKHNRIGTDDGYGYVWTAVSRPPWLHALALWPDQWGTYLGEGHFLADKKIAIRTYSGEIPTPHPDHPAPKDLVVVGDREAPYQESSHEVDGAEWSGRDQREHIVYARDGRLFRRVNWKDHELIDFNDRVPEPSVAPAWAQRWYRRSK